jgi:hypothetical protein
MLGNLEGVPNDFRDRIFVKDLVEPLHDRKDLYMQKIEESLRTRSVEIMDSEGNKKYLSNQELSEFIKVRNETRSILPEKFYS